MCIRYNYAAQGCQLKVTVLSMCLDLFYGCTHVLILQHVLLSCLYMRTCLASVLDEQKE